MVSEWYGCHTPLWLAEQNYFPLHFLNSLLGEWSQDIPSHNPAATLVVGKPPGQGQGRCCTAAAAAPSSSPAHAPLGR